MKTAKSIYLYNACDNIIESSMVAESVSLFNDDFEASGLSFLESDGFAVTMINGIYFFNTANDGCFSEQSNPELSNIYINFL